MSVTLTVTYQIVGEQCRDQPAPDIQPALPISQPPAYVPASTYQFGTHALAFYNAESIKGTRYFPPAQAGGVPGAIQGQEYQFGTHAKALYQAEAYKSVTWKSLTGGTANPTGYLLQGMDAAPQDYPYLHQAWVRGSAFKGPQGFQPIQRYAAAPQLFDLTLPAVWQNALPTPPAVIPSNTTCGVIDAYDNGNGSILLEWGKFGGVTPDSYNVYVDGVFNQNVLDSSGRLATVTGLRFSTYNGAVLTPSGTYDFKIVAVKGGFETSCSVDKILTAQPTSVMLVTPMKRIFPFPNTGLE